MQGQGVCTRFQPLSAQVSNRQLQTFQLLRLNGVVGPGATYALATFMTGVLLLLAWLYANIDNPRSGAILKKSLLLFALPILLWPGFLFRFPLGMFVSIGCEEGLKAFASTREQNQRDKFWLVTLFGIWELALDKPLWGLVLAKSGESWDRLSLIGFVFATALPVLMHAVTAAFYAFALERRLWAACLIGWTIHAAFNETVDYFAPSPVVVVTQTAILIGLLAALFSGRLRTPAPGTR